MAKREYKGKPCTYTDFEIMLRARSQTELGGESSTIALYVKDESGYAGQAELPTGERGGPQGRILENSHRGAWAVALFPARDVIKWCLELGVW